MEMNDSQSPEQAGLFGQEPAVRRELIDRKPGAPRLMHAQRDQVELRPVHLDALLAADHPVRSVWAFVQVLDTTELYAKVKSVEGMAGAPAIDPSILVGLWLWATIDGVGSAREIDRLCQRDHTYEWLCGGVGVNHHSLADFRTKHAEWLDSQLTRSITALMERKLVTLDVVTQDGLRVRASAKASSFRRKDKLLALQAIAQDQVRALKAELEADAGASSRRKQAARERAARERAQRLEQALGTLEKIKRGGIDKAQEKAKARAARNKSGKTRPRAKSEEDEAKKGSSATAKKETRVSVTDPEARVMKMADGGFRPAFNVQLAVDEATQLIAGIAVVSEGSDMAEMQSMHEQINHRYGTRPGHWLADGGYPKYEAIETLSRLGTQPVVPPARSRKASFDPLAANPSDSPAIAEWRALMASDEGRSLYKRRAASVECTNAQIRRRGLYRFNVCGKLKARAVVLWQALAHNLMRMQSLGIAFAA